LEIVRICVNTITAEKSVLGEKHRLVNRCGDEPQLVHAYNGGGAPPKKSSEPDRRSDDKTRRHANNVEYVKHRTTLIVQYRHQKLTSFHRASSKPAF
jgi:hypothetical protein